MIHIVFNQADIPVLQKAVDMDESLQGDIWQVKDDYAVGPLTNLYSTEGAAARKQWWREVLAGGDYDGKVDSGEVNDEQLLTDIRERLESNPAEKIWIWAAQNKHDVSGYYWLMSQLKNYQGRIFILYLNNLPFINEKGQIFYPEWLHSIPPKEFIKAKRLARPITLSEFEVDPDEWARLSAEDKGVRLLEGGKKLMQEGYEFYDEELKKMVGTDWQKASRLIGQFLSKAKHTTGDAYLLWRLKGLIAAGQLDVQGDTRKMKDFEVKVKSTSLQETA
jgi:hypothetical protein